MFNELTIGDIGNLFSALFSVSVFTEIHCHSSATHLTVHLAWRNSPAEPLGRNSPDEPLGRN
jgi:hypothetical protein